MKILTILGTRPEIIRLSRVIPLLDEVCDKHILVHTGQNYDNELSSNFFDELGLRTPDYNWEVRGFVGEQLAGIFTQADLAVNFHHPDRVLVLGDTNSSLAAIVAARLRIPVYHMEAGNRCYDPRSPEEVNRRLIDHASSVLLPYTERSRQNLLAEGIEGRRIFVTGNPIHEVIEYYSGKIDQSDIFNRLEIGRGGYLLVTLHREENVDDSKRLENFLHAFSVLQANYEIPVIISTHPRTRQRIIELNGTRRSIALGDNFAQIRFLPPFPFFDFIALQQHAFCVLSDSGTVQEESCLLHVPSVTLRDTTERPETVEAGASVLSGADPARIVALVKQVTERKPNWTVPAEYLRTNVAETVVRIITGHHQGGQQ